ncbi:MAG: caspase family protein [Elainella sp.]
MRREALVVGINYYEHKDLESLKAPAADAEAIAQCLEKYGNFTVQRLPQFRDPLDNNARKVATTEAKARVSLNELKRAIATLFNPDSDRQLPDTALLYFSGHGVVTNIGVKEGYLAASDTNPEDGSDGLSLKWLGELLAESPVREQIVWIDACHSGELLNVKQAASSEAGKFRSRFIIASSRDYQKSYTAIGSPYSVVTKALIEGLDPSRFPDRWLTDIDLRSYMQDVLKGEEQKPVYRNLGESIELTRTLAAQAAVVTEPKPVDETCPYQGLQFFTAATARWYCGRDRLVDDLLQKLGQSTFVPVIGASGSGKSSLVRAGLLPVVEKRGWEILGPILPGGGLLSPADKVADLLLKRFDDADEAAEVQVLLERGQLCEAVQRIPGEQTLLLVIDQYEELFTRVTAEAARQTFVQLLAGAAAETAGRLRIVTTMRADFMDRFLTYRELADLATQDRICWVGPMNEAELRAAIAKPAEINSYHLEPGLLELIVRDVEAEPNSLPLLEFALTLLWDKRDLNQHCLTTEAYQDLGGLKGALDRHAEAVFNEAEIKDHQGSYKNLRLATDEERQWAQRIFRRLVRTLPGTKDTRQRQLRREILGLGRCDADRQVIEKVLGKFERGRLLIPDKDESDHPNVDLAHEALIEGWQRFADWRKADRDVQRLVDRIVDAYNGWQAAPVENQPKFLLPEGVVAQVEAAIAISDYLSNQQEQFVQQSRYTYKPWVIVKSGV